jgi:hypothetical protein
VAEARSFMIRWRDARVSCPRTKVHVGSSPTSCTFLIINNYTVNFSTLATEYFLPSP